MIRSLARIGVAALALVLCSHQASADGPTAAQARRAIMEMDWSRADKLLSTEDDSPEIALERARLALHRGDCDGAVAALGRPDLEESDAAATLLGVAKGCARGSAAAVTVRDEERGVVVRLGDDADRPLVGPLVDTAARTRTALERDLGVRLPSPIFIELVRDQFTLAAMTGLPERAAKTTGTIGIAKWGRVFLVSPRAAPSGYAWLDTLAHELTHIALTLATLDRAPLWLQEGISKREETRWRLPEPLDHFPSPDAVAQYGLQKGLGRALTDLGPSVAMLPSPAEATVVFAEVASFIDFWVAEVGEAALPKLLVALKNAAAGSSVDDAIRSVSGADLATWERRWREHLLSVDTTLPVELRPGERPKHARKITRAVRLGELLLDRGHVDVATAQFESAFELAPAIPTVRCALASAKLALGDLPDAAVLVERSSDLHQRSGRWWSLHGLLFDDEPNARSRAIALDPLNPAVACDEWLPPSLPSEQLRRALCEAARQGPQRPL